MAITPAVQEYLRNSHVPYSVFPHRPAYSAQEEAAVTHTPGRDWAKVVACFADTQPILVVVPADTLVNFDRLLPLVDAYRVRLTTEEELDWLYPDCERGAMPPFGALYKQAVFVDLALATEESIVFNGGTHGDAVRMRFDDFAELAKPVVGQFAEKPLD
jgi:Ala-tRNA(Pro) deacylase